jgi:dihydrofolate synthase/folylpolyglutamate synthase
LIDYKNTVAELFDLQKFAIKLGLDNITALMRLLNNPHKDYPVIHIAGTNGKGSTAFFLAGILEAAGLKTGLFTSPHLIDFRERMRVNGKMIEQSDVNHFWRRVKNDVLKRKATFFDTTAAMAFDYFSREKVDVAVIETGLGGRLDSTNVADSEIAVITPIDFDHQKQLGNTLSQIAFEKAGIIKKRSAVFCAAQQEETLPVLKQPQNGGFYYLPDFIRITIKSASLDSMIFDIHDALFNDIITDLNSRQVGNYQAENIGLAYLTARYFLKKHAINFEHNIVKEKLKNYFWPGRLQTISKNPRIIFDVSHNPAGIKTTLKYLSSMIEKKKLHILLGIVEDKSYEEIAAAAVWNCNSVYLTEPDTHRKLDGQILLETFNRLHKKAELINEPQKAYNYAKSKLKKDETLLVIGSHYLIGHLLAKLKKNK